MLYCSTLLINNMREMGKDVMSTTTQYSVNKLFHSSYFSQSILGVISILDYYWSCSQTVLTSQKKMSRVYSIYIILFTNTHIYTTPGAYCVPSLPFDTITTGCICRSACRLIFSLFKDDFWAETICYWWMGHQEICEADA